MSENAFEPMMGEDLMFPGRYLKSVELKGRDVPITIDRVDKEELLKRDKKTKETKWILHFRESEKALVLNVTNARTITGLYGNAKGWAGKRITLYPTTCHGERSVLVSRNMSLRAALYSSHILVATSSIGLNFHCLSGSSRRASSRCFCSLLEISR